MLYKILISPVVLILSIVIGIFKVYLWVTGQSNDAAEYANRHW